jgi:D-alanyl-D-alanine carboxypeptidase
MNILAGLTILLLLFPSVQFYRNVYNSAFTNRLFVRIDSVIEQQYRQLHDNPIIVDLSAPRLWPTPPQKVNNINLELPVTSSLAIDVASHQQLFAQDADVPLPIASITKLMTALVFLDHNPGWDTEYEMQDTDRREGGQIRLYTGDQLTAKDLFYAALVGSENTAITGLVNLTGMSETEFVAQMNQQAKILKMNNSNFADPTGLSPQNQASARDVFKLINAALNKAEIKQAVSTKQYQFYTKAGQEKVFETTDDLLGSAPGGAKVLGGKTGYLEEGGYCFAAMFDQRGHQVITVVLGAQDRWQRFTQTSKLLEWIFAGYVWPAK